MKIIGFVGLPGSGKSEASKIARRHGLAVVVMGDVIRQEAARQNLEPTDQNLGRIGNALRANEGPDVIAKRTLKSVMATGKDVVVVDGLRSGEEVDFFRNHAGEFHLVEVSAPMEARMMWLAARGRPDDPGKGMANYGKTDGDAKIVTSCFEADNFAAEAMEQRECREMGWGMHEAIKAADMKLVNDGRLDDFQESVEKLLVLLQAGPTSLDDEQK